MQGVSDVGPESPSTMESMQSMMSKIQDHLKLMSNEENPRCPLIIHDSILGQKFHIKEEVKDGSEPEVQPYRPNISTFHTHCNYRDSFSEDTTTEDKTGSNILFGGDRRHTSSTWSSKSYTSNTYTSSTGSNMRGRYPSDTGHDAIANSYTGGTVSHLLSPTIPCTDLIENIVSDIRGVKFNEHDQSNPIQGSSVGKSLNSTLGLNQKCIILGDRFSGKTTTFHYLSYHLVMYSLNGLNKVLHSSYDDNSLSNRFPRQHTDRHPQRHGLVIPFFISLSKYPNDLMKAKLKRRLTYSSLPPLQSKQHASSSQSSSPTSSQTSPLIYASSPPPQATPMAFLSSSSSSSSFSSPLLPPASSTSSPQPLKSSSPPLPPPPPPLLLSDSKLLTNSQSSSPNQSLLRLYPVTDDSSSFFNSSKNTPLSSSSLSSSNTANSPKNIISSPITQISSQSSSPISTSPGQSSHSPPVIPPPILGHLLSSSSSLLSKTATTATPPSSSSSSTTKTSNLFDNNDLPSIIDLYARSDEEREIIQFFLSPENIQRFQCKLVFFFDGLENVQEKNREKFHLELESLASKHSVFINSTVRKFPFDFFLNHNWSLYQMAPLSSYRKEFLAEKMLLRYFRNISNKNQAVRNDQITFKSETQEIGNEGESDPKVPDGRYESNEKQEKVKDIHNESDRNESKNLDIDSYEEDDDEDDDENMKNVETYLSHFEKLFIQNIHHKWITSNPYRLSLCVAYFLHNEGNTKDICTDTIPIFGHLLFFQIYQLIQYSKQTKSLQQKDMPPKFKNLIDNVSASKDFRVRFEKDFWNALKHFAYHLHINRTYKFSHITLVKDVLPSYLSRKENTGSIKRGELVSSITRGYEWLNHFFKYQMIPFFVNIKRHKVSATSATGSKDFEEYPADYQFIFNVYQEYLCSQYIYGEIYQIDDKKSNFNTSFFGKIISSASSTTLKPVFDYFIKPTLYDAWFHNVLINLCQSLMETTTSEMSSTGSSSLNGMKKFVELCKYLIQQEDSHCFVSSTFVEFIVRRLIKRRAIQYSINNSVGKDNEISEFLDSLMTVMSYVMKRYQSIDVGIETYAHCLTHPSPRFQQLFLHFRPVFNYYFNLTSSNFILQNGYDGSYGGSTWSRSKVKSKELKSVLCNLYKILLNGNYKTYVHCREKLLLLQLSLMLFRYETVFSANGEIPNEVKSFCLALVRVVSLNEIVHELEKRVFVDTIDIQVHKEKMDMWNKFETFVRILKSEVEIHFSTPDAEIITFSSQLKQAVFNRTYGFDRDSGAGDVRIAYGLGYYSIVNDIAATCQIEEEATKREQSSDSLSLHTRRIISWFLRCLNDKNENVREFAVQGLSNYDPACIHSEQIISSLLIVASNDSSEFIRITALESLTKYTSSSKHNDIVNKLHEIVRDEKSDRIREVAQKVMKDFNKYQQNFESNEKNDKNPQDASGKKLEDNPGVHENEKDDVIISRLLKSLIQLKNNDPNKESVLRQIRIYSQLSIHEKLASEMLKILADPSSNDKVKANCAMSLSYFGCSTNVMQITQELINLIIKNSEFIEKIQYTGATHQKMVKRIESTDPTNSSHNLKTLRRVCEKSAKTLGIFSSSHQSNEIAKLLIESYKHHCTTVIAKSYLILIFGYYSRHTISGELISILIDTLNLELEGKASADPLNNSENIILSQNAAISLGSFSSLTYHSDFVVKRIMEQIRDVLGRLDNRNIKKSQSHVQFQSKNLVQEKKLVNMIEMVGRFAEKSSHMKAVVAILLDIGRIFRKSNVEIICAVVKALQSCYDTIEECDDIVVMLLQFLDNTFLYGIHHLIIDTLSRYHFSHRIGTILAFMLKLMNDKRSSIRASASKSLGNFFWASSEVDIIVNKLIKSYKEEPNEQVKISILEALSHYANTQRGEDIASFLTMMLSENGVPTAQTASASVGSSSGMFQSGESENIRAAILKSLSNFGYSSKAMNIISDIETIITQKLKQKTKQKSQLADNNYNVLGRGEGGKLTTIFSLLSITSLSSSSLCYPSIVSYVITLLRQHLSNEYDEHIRQAAMLGLGHLFYSSHNGEIVAELRGILMEDKTTLSRLCALHTIHNFSIFNQTCSYAEDVVHLLQLLLKQILENSKEYSDIIITFMLETMNNLIPQLPQMDSVNAQIERLINLYFNDNSTVPVKASIMKVLTTICLKTHLSPLHQYHHHHYHHHSQSNQHLLTFSFLIPLLMSHISNQYQQKLMDVLNSSSITITNSTVSPVSTSNTDTGSDGVPPSTITDDPDQNRKDMGEIKTGNTCLILTSIKLITKLMKAASKYNIPIEYDEITYHIFNGLSCFHGKLKAYMIKALGYCRIHEHLDSKSHSEQKSPKNHHTDNSYILNILLEYAQTCNHFLTKTFAINTIGKLIKYRVLEPLSEGRVITTFLNMLNLKTQQRDSRIALSIFNALRYSVIFTAWIGHENNSNHISTSGSSSGSATSTTLGSLSKKVKNKPLLSIIDLHHVEPKYQIAVKQRVIQEIVKPRSSREVKLTLYFKYIYRNPHFIQDNTMLQTIVNHFETHGNWFIEAIIYYLEFQLMFTSIEKWRKHPMIPVMLKLDRILHRILTYSDNDGDYENYNENAQGNSDHDGSDKDDGGKSNENDGREGAQHESFTNESPQNSSRYQGSESHQQTLGSKSQTSSRVPQRGSRSKNMISDHPLFWEAFVLRHFMMTSCSFSVLSNNSSKLSNLFRRGSNAR